MAMTFAGAWGTWSVADADLPDYVPGGLINPGSIRRNFNGGARKYLRYSNAKQTWNLSWTMATGTAKNNTQSMAEAETVSTWTSDLGTYSVYAPGESWQWSESGYQVYNISLTLEQV